MRNFKINGPYAIIVTGLIILVTFFQGCSYKEVTFISVDDVMVGDLQDSTTQLDLMVTIQNPNNKEISINSLNAFIVLNSVDVGNVNLMEPTTIPAKGEHQIKIPLTLKLKSHPLAIAAGLGLGILTNNIVLRISGEGSGKMGLIKVNLPIEHEEKVPVDAIEGLWN